MIKYCTTCNIYRSPWTHHCDTCGFCIEKFDHHCAFIGTCIGKKNYVDFVLYVLFMTLETFYTAVTSLIFLCIGLSDSDLYKEHKAWEIIKLAALLIILVISLIVGLFVIYLLIYHLRLIFKNLTTYEQIK